MNGNVAESLHALQTTRRVGVDQAATLERREAFARIVRNAEALFANRRVRKIDGDLARSRDIEYGCNLFREIVPEVASGRCLLISCSRDAALERRQLSCRDAHRWPPSGPRMYCSTIPARRGLKSA